MKINYLFLGAWALLSACTSVDDAEMPQSSTPVELKGISASICQGAAVTRAVAALSDTVGRTAFATGDNIVFTDIERTENPIKSFTYKNIHYQYTVEGNSGSWSRVDNDPEKLYWTDGSSFHTFMGYCLPSADISWNAGTDGTYTGHLTTTDFTGGNDIIVKEDLLLCCNEDVTSPDGVSAAVSLTHALSNVRVVVNIKDFAASAGATDVDAKVSDMQLLGQPVNFVWDGKTASLKVADGDKFENTIKLWCPNNDGKGDKQNRTFTFYGLAVPSDQEVEFSFTVTYPNALNPSQTLEKVYQGKFANKVYFHSGKCTTLNITLSHQNEQIFTGAQYSDWSFVATPDLGELRKKSTYMTDNMTVATCASATSADDATWLYKLGNDVYDIYGHDGNSADKAYCITSAQQMKSFAEEVNSGNMDFAGKYIRLDADITMQKSATDTDYSWAGIGTGSVAFNGTFLGGDRYINRLKGKPLFISLGTDARVEQLYITTIGAVNEGALAGINAGVIGACKVIDEVETTSGVLVGTNNGTVYACYHTGAANGVQLVGTNNAEDKTVGCYVASDYSAITSAKVGELNDKLTTLYSTNKTLTQYKYEYSAGSYPTVKKQ